MIKNRFLLVAAVGLLFYISINFGPVFREKIISFPLKIKTVFVDTTHHIKQKIDTFYQQKEKIATLQKALESCQKDASLSVAFASKLNHFLEEANLHTYDPSLKLIHGLSYVKLGDFSRMWVDFPDYNQSKIYGLIYQGYAAGIVDVMHGHAMARLLSNPKMIFSVAIGKHKNLGVAFGGKMFLSVKYIPTYAQIRVGDEVITSGNDNIFYEGVKVGQVIDIQQYNLYKMAIVKPYAILNGPEFFYAVDSNLKVPQEANTTQKSDALK